MAKHLVGCPGKLVGHVPWSGYATSKSFFTILSYSFTRIKYLLQNCMQMKQPKRALPSNISVLGIATILHYNHVHNPSSMDLLYDLSLPQCVCIRGSNCCHCWGAWHVEGCLACCEIITCISHLRNEILCH